MLHPWRCRHQRTVRGRSGWLDLLRRTLSFPTPSRFYPGAFDVPVRSPNPFGIKRHLAWRLLLPTIGYDGNMANVVQINPNVLGGTPVFYGTRVPVESFFDYLKRGRTIDYFLEQFPTVNRQQVELLLDEAKSKTVPQRVSA